MLERGFALLLELRVARKFVAFLFALCVGSSHRALSGTATTQSSLKTRRNTTENAKLDAAAAKTTPLRKIFFFLCSVLFEQN